MAIPQGFIQDLLTRVDVVDVVGRHVQLKKAGANYLGLCPFHGEKSPSFTVSPTKQFYHCFGCGKNGNAIGFLMEHAGMGFVDAVTDLAQQVGMQVPQDDASPEERARAAQRREQQLSLTQILGKAAAAYRGQLKTSPRAIDYLKGRGLTGEIAQRFGLGFAPTGWHFLSSVFGQYDDPLLVEAGLTIEREGDGSEHDAERATAASGSQRRWDRFRDRIMFPIRNVKGEIIGFGGRVLGEGTPKYLNSPETPVFSKGHELYGLYEARADIHSLGHVLVTEGYMDVVALAQLGLPNAVATLGTACTPDHVHKLFRHSDTVVFSFDGDAAGRRAARKALDVALPFAGDTRSVKFLFLPEEHDPDSYIRAHGRDAFARCVSDAMPLSRFLIESAREGCDLSTAEGRARLSAQALPLWSNLPEGVLKRQLLAELAALVQLDVAELSTLWLDPARTRRRPVGDDRDGGGRARPPGPASPPPPARRRSAPPSRADHIARILLSHSGAWSELSGDEQAHLCHLPAPHGPLFAWLEGQWQEHGGQPWVALREALNGQDSEATAVAIMDRLDPGQQIEGDIVDAHARELRGAVLGMRIEAIKLEQDHIMQAGPTPEGLQRWRELKAERDRLEGRAPA